MTKEQKIDEILNRGVTNIIPCRPSLKKRLLSGEILNIYYGIDPTNTRLHIGYGVHLRKLQQFVELGHNVMLLIGDFTALIGDTSDKESERPILTTNQIKENLKTYKQQASKILDFTKIKLVFNSEWLSKLAFHDVVELCQHFSLNDFISRELIKKRLDSGGHVRLDEVLYPVMQGYDSYHLDTDLQLGAADQTFNMQAGRILMKDLRQKESFILVNDYLLGTDGRKMSKTWNNGIWVEDEPDEMYGKTMSLKDSLLIPYFTLATSLELSLVAEKEERLKKGENPMKLKKELAFEIVKELHNEEEAKKSQENFEATFQKKHLPDEIPTFKLRAEENQLADVLAESKFASSKAEAKRLIQQGAVELNGQVVKDPKYLIETIGDTIIKVGKLKFLKVVGAAGR